MAQEIRQVKSFKKLWSLQKKASHTVLYTINWIFDMRPDNQLKSPRTHTLWGPCSIIHQLDALNLHFSFICMCSNKYPHRDCVLWQKYLGFINSEDEVQVLPRKQWSGHANSRSGTLLRHMNNSNRFTSRLQLLSYFFNTSARCTQM